MGFQCCAAQRRLSFCEKAFRIVKICTYPIER
ncbi:hypothetical protein CBM2587_B10112 [Cupriavidus taiwanensis]|uniref:Uncharacterized protein n=1 Tax=Cupriavidus taiwanensis TaxID=164546 RepID=A0A975X497_9BURK|nr:hypothetical protein CBM2587_B10112 [Cupriavidus taiwanensis]